MFVLSFALATTPTRVETVRASVDWQAVAKVSATRLRTYLAIDTVAPPGNEADGVRFLKEHTDRIGLESMVVDHGDNRASLVARLKGSGSQKPICLMSHIDVVPFERDRWTHDPTGVIEDGVVWGRGAIDMKGMAIVQLAALEQLAKQNVRLKRDIVLLAVAGEEVDGLGARTLADEHWADIDCGVVLNEGGLALEDAFFDGQTVHAISVAEKGVLWARMVATGEPGHGSTIDDGEAPLSLLEAMSRIEKTYDPKPVMGPIHKEMLSRIGAHHGGFVGGLMKSGLGRNLLVKPKLMKISTQRALLTNTVHLTGMGGASSTNVVPSTSWASYDCRLLPGVTPTDFLAELKELTKGLDVRWDVQLEMTSNQSPWEDPFFERLAHYAVEGSDEAVAAPILSPGFTDSIFLRPKGAKAYGYLPFVLDETALGSMHGDDEGISIDNLGRGARVLFGLLLDVAGEP